MSAIYHDKALELTQDLIRCPSITPKTAGVYDVLVPYLERLGFTCTLLTFEEDGLEPVTNLHAIIGNGAPHFCYAGHVDVVPVGDKEAWTYPPFGAEIHDGKLYGRGTSDMKGSIAAFIAAAEHFLNADFDGTLSLIIAGDEEDARIAGTKHVLKWLDARDMIPDLCLVGEPTNPETLGEMIKIGRRGSVTGRMTVHGIQGHAAYPHLARNPMPDMIAIAQMLNTMHFDNGTEFFDTTNLEIVSIETGNKTDNVIPAKVEAIFNIRFNDLHQSAEIIDKIETKIKSITEHYTIDWHVSGESFLTPLGTLSETISKAVASVTGKTPELTTTGGTSDARFVTKYCPVVEFGGINKTIHKVNEYIKVDDLYALTDVYLKSLALIYNL